MKDVNVRIVGPKHLVEKVIDAINLRCNIKKTRRYPRIPPRYAKHPSQGDITAYLKVVE